MKSPMKFIDKMLRKTDTVQVLLIRKGEPVMGLYSDGTREVRSPNMGPKERHDLAVRKH